MIEEFPKRGVMPVVPRQGAIGASGDVAPLAHMAAAMIGAGKAKYDGFVMPRFGGDGPGPACPDRLGAPRGVGPFQLHSVFDCLRVCWDLGAWNNLHAALVTEASSTDATMVSITPLVKEIHSPVGYAG